MARIFKLWDIDRKLKKCFSSVCELQKIIEIGREKGIVGDKIVLESDGTDIEDNITLDYYSNEVFLLIRNDESWSPPKQLISKEEATCPETHNNELNVFSCGTSQSKPSLLTNHSLVVTHPSTSDNVQLIQFVEETNANEYENATEAEIPTDDEDLSLVTNSRVSLNSVANYKVQWGNISSGIMDILIKEKPIGERLHDFVHEVIADMRKFSKHLTVPICRDVAKHAISVYPKSFGILDHHGNLIDVEAVALTTTLINHNHYLNRRDKISFLPRKKLLSKDAKKAQSMSSHVPNFSGMGMENDDEDTILRMEDNRVWLKNNALIQFLDEESLQKRDTLFMASFNLQRSFLNNFQNPPTIFQIQLEWPILLKKKYLLLHYQKLMNLETEIFSENFMKSAPKINNFARTSKQITLSVDEDMNILALKNISSYFKEKLEQIYVVFPEGTPTDQFNIECNNPLIAAVVVEILEVDDNGSRLGGHVTPPYRMPPQPPTGASSLYGDAPMPGAALEPQHINGISGLRTHSSKFPIERELILSSDKSASKIPLMHESRTPSGLRRATGLQLLSPRPHGAIAPDHPPKQMQAWNTQSPCLQPQQQQSPQQHHVDMSGAIPRAPARLPEDVTALAERDRDLKDTNKNAVAKTYHTLKDLISSKFKKENNESFDGLNNVSVQLQQQQQQDEYRSPYSALPAHMRQNQTLNQNLNQSQPNIWMGGGRPIESPPMRQPLPGQTGGGGGGQRNYTPEPQRSVNQQQRAASQPQLNMNFERRSTLPFQTDPQQQQQMVTERRGSLANIDVTDSDDGGFIAKQRRPQTMYHLTPQQMLQQSPTPVQQQMHLQQQQSLINGNGGMGPLPPQVQHHQRQSPHVFQNGNHMLQQQQQNHELYVQYQQQFQNQQQQNLNLQSQIQMAPNAQVPARHDQIRVSKSENISQQKLEKPQPPQRPDRPDRPSSSNDILKQVPGSNASSDYDKSGNQSSNVDSGRGSAAYSSSRKGGVLQHHDTSPDSSDSVIRPSKDNDSDWVDIVDAELRNILEPQMQELSIRPESTVSGSVSSITPPIPDIPQNTRHMKDPPSKQEYGTDSYNRPGKGPIGPSRAGWPGSSIQKQVSGPRLTSSSKKHEQALLKRHLFGLDNDMTSTTTRSLDLESLLGAQWGNAPSISDSETDTQGLRHIRNQLEGLENMYSEVLRMLGGRNPNPRVSEGQFNGRRRHGSLSSLPSSSVSGRPIRDRRRIEGRRKVRDIKGINKRFQRLESHVVTLARSVAHLSSEMRSQHLVMQELERMRDEFANLRNQSSRFQNNNTNNISIPEPPNLTNPRRVKKLTKFFGEDPPLMRLFLKTLGYEKYANLFEAERVGMIELPYLGEERLQKLGIPLGPRLRILQEAQISLCKDTTLCIV